MNRDETLDHLEENLKTWSNLSEWYIGDWRFVEGVFYHDSHKPITIHDWNRDKIKPNTKIRIESPEHSEYVQKLAFEAGFEWESGEREVRYKDKSHLVFYESMTFIFTDKPVMFRSDKKEIHIEMPKTQTKEKTREELEEENVFERVVAVNREHYQESGVEMSPVEEMAASVSNFNAKVLAEKVGSKHDQGKPRYDLIPPHAEAEFVDVLTFGATKYEPNQWRNVPNAKERYTAATMRHLASYRMGETHDIESGKHHLAHAMCCLAFIIEIDLEDEDK